MATNRTRIKRDARSRVSDEARQVYAEALKLRDIHDAHSRGMCPTPGKHCDDCDRYVDLKRQLGGLIGLSSLLRSPLEVDSEDPPDYMRENPWQSGLWRKAWSLRVELEK